MNFLSFKFNVNLINPVSCLAGKKPGYIVRVLVLGWVFSWRRPEKIDVV